MTTRVERRIVERQRLRVADHELDVAAQCRPPAVFACAIIAGLRSMPVTVTSAG